MLGGMSVGGGGWSVVGGATGLTAEGRDGEGKRGTARPVGPVRLALKCEAGKHGGWESELMCFDRRVLESLRQVCVGVLCCNSVLTAPCLAPPLPLAALAGETWATGHVAGRTPKTPTRCWHTGGVHTAAVLLAAGLPGLLVAAAVVRRTVQQACHPHSQVVHQGEWNLLRRRCCPANLQRPNSPGVQGRCPDPWLERHRPADLCQAVGAWTGRCRWVDRQCLPFAEG